MTAHQLTPAEWRTLGDLFTSPELVANLHRDALQSLRDRDLAHVEGPIATITDAGRDAYRRADYAAYSMLDQQLRRAP